MTLFGEENLQKTIIVAKNMEPWDVCAFSEIKLALNVKVTVFLF